jgi:aldose 1-epimerase
MDRTGLADWRHDLVLEAAGTSLRVRPEAGGRLVSVIVDDQELLVTDDRDGPVSWGSYPMAPWAGRIRHGQFTFDGRSHQLPITMAPHAIHGVVHDRPWTIVDERTLAIELDDRWPFRGQVEQHFALDEDGLAVTMTLEADEPMPAVIGWHPWFNRMLAPGRAPAIVRFNPAEMLVRDAEGIPTGERVPPSVGPWDDAFTGVADPPVIEWPGQLRVELSSSCAWWVVYDAPRHAVCVEPQSGPPDAVNLAPEVVTPGTPLTHVMRWRWTRG